MGIFKGTSRIAWYGITSVMIVLQLSVLIQIPTVLAAEATNYASATMIPTIPASTTQTSNTETKSTQGTPVQQSLAPTSPLSAPTLVAATTTTSFTTNAANNANFAFVESNNGTNKTLTLQNKTNGRNTLLLTVSSSQYLVYDVDPAGKYAYVNIQTSGSIATGKTKVFDIAKNVLTTVNQVSDATGASLGMVSDIDGIWLSRRFKNNYLIMDVKTINGSTNIIWSVVLNLNLSTIRYTKLPISTLNYYGTYANTAGEPVITPQGDRFIFGGRVNATNTYALGFYNPYDGSFYYKTLPGLTGVDTYNGIKALSAHGNMVIIGSKTQNIVYAVSIRDANPAKLITIPLPAGAVASSYILSSASFLDQSQTVEIVTQNGSHYAINGLTGTLTGPLAAEIFSQFRAFYGPVPPTGSYDPTFKITSITTTSTDVYFTVSLNSSTATGVVQNHSMDIKYVYGVWRTWSVQERDYYNTQIYWDAFAYNNYTPFSFKEISRYKGYNYSSPILKVTVDGSNYKITAYEGYTVLNTSWVSITTPFYLVLQTVFAPTTPTIAPSTNQSATITQLPATTPGIFSSAATVSNTVSSSNTLTNNYTGTSASSFGGLYLNYSTPINFNTLFPNGIVFQVSSPNVTSMALEIKDQNGNVWKANLINVNSTGQKYFIALSQIQGLDLTNIKEVVFVQTGAGTKTINLTWGQFSGPISI